MNGWRMFDGACNSLYGDGPPYADLIAAAGPCRVLRLEEDEPGAEFDFDLILFVPSVDAWSPIPPPVVVEALATADRGGRFALHGERASVERVIEAILSAEAGNA